MSRLIGRSFAAVVVLAALVFAIAMIGGQFQVSAEHPDVNDRLNDIEDELTLVSSRMSGVRDDLNLVRDQVGGVRDELALMRNQMERLTRAVGSSSISDPAAYTQAFVEDAINRYEAKGRDETIAYYNTPESADGDWYMFIADEAGLTLSHVIPALLGTDGKTRTGPDGYPVGLAIVNSATEQGRWVDYVYLNPNTGGVESKHSWVVARRADLRLRLVRGGPIQGQRAGRVHEAVCGAGRTPPRHRRPRCRARLLQHHAERGRRLVRLRH